MSTNFYESLILIIINFILEHHDMWLSFLG